MHSLSLYLLEWLNKLFQISVAFLLVPPQPTRRAMVVLVFPLSSVSIPIPRPRLHDC